MNKTPKICMISPLGYTGIGYYDYSLCESLMKNNVDLTLFSSENWIVRKNHFFKREVLFKGTMGDMPRTLKGVNYLKAWGQSIFRIVLQKYDVIHLQMLELPVVDCFFMLSLKLLRKKVVFTPHDIYSLKSKNNNIFLKLMYKASDYIIVHNEANRNLLVNECGILSNKIKIIAHGNYNYFLNTNLRKGEAKDRINIPKEKKIILLFGNIRPGKSFETTISAFKLLRNKDNVLLLIAGKLARGIKLDVLKKEIEESGLIDNIILRNHFIEDPLIESYYKASDVVVVPYERGYESGVLRYAFSCGVPTIISNLKEFSQFAVDGENCLIFRAKDSTHLAEKLNIILDNPEIANKIAHNAKKLSDNEWDWRESAYQTKKIYEKFHLKTFL